MLDWSFVNLEAELVLVWCIPVQVPLVDDQLAVLVDLERFRRHLEEVVAQCRLVRRLKNVINVVRSAPKVVLAR